MLRRGRRDGGVGRPRRGTGGPARQDRRPRWSRPPGGPDGAERRVLRGRRWRVERRSLVLTRYHAIMSGMARTTTATTTTTTPATGVEQLDLVDGIDELAVAIRTLR